MKNTLLIAFCFTSFLAIGQQTNEDSLNTIDSYDWTIEKADLLFDMMEFEDAKELYIEAVSIRLDEPYPINRIAEIDQLLAQIAANEALQKQYESYILKGDDAYTLGEYEQAISHYEQALALLPDEDYPKDMIGKIHDVLYELNEVAAEYDRLIYEADNAYHAQKYMDAKNYYYKALELKPDESYPADQIDMINARLEEKN